MRMQNCIPAGPPMVARQAGRREVTGPRTTDISVNDPSAHTWPHHGAGNAPSELTIVSGLRSAMRKDAIAFVSKPRRSSRREASVGSNSARPGGGHRLRIAGRCESFDLLFRQRAGVDAHVVNQAVEAVLAPVLIRPQRDRSARRVRALS